MEGPGDPPDRARATDNTEVQLPGAVPSPTHDARRPGGEGAPAEIERAVAAAPQAAEHRAPAAVSCGSDDKRETEGDGKAGVAGIGPRRAKLGSAVTGAESGAASSLGFCSIVTQGPPVLDVYSLRRADGAMFVFSLMPLVTDIVRMARESDVSVFRDGFEVDFTQPEMITTIVVTAITAVEYAIRAISRKRSMMYRLSHCLPPQGVGIPFPAEVRKFQSAQFCMMVLMGMLFRTLNMLEPALVMSTIVTISMFANWTCNW